MVARANDTPRINHWSRRKLCWQTGGGALSHGVAVQRDACRRVSPPPGCMSRTRRHNALGIWKPAHVSRANLADGERRASGEHKYYLSNLSGDMPIKTLVGAVKARWVCEQSHQQLKEELGLDQFEGRSRRGLHRHALMRMIAHVFLHRRRLATARRGKKSHRTTSRAKLAGCASRHHRSPDPTDTATMLPL